MENKKQVFKERINYVQGFYGFTGQSVNIPGLIVEGDSLEELEKSAKDMLEVIIEHLTDLLEQEEPFEFKEVSLSEFLKK